ncbi:MAG: hypothetical protein KatS3mg014_0889 [Actinomycetota bacterium]|nr:MAG: hypothetical protein KatS3mg014_0889 [Actinomycetota bacterium]
MGRLRGRRFPRLARPAAWAITTLAGGLAVLAALLPTVIWRESAPATDRPRSGARIEILEPREGQAVSGTSVRLVTRLVGGRVVGPEDTELRSDTGHVHVYLDDRLVSMSYAPEQEIPLGDLERGPHVLRVEFVAADHGPFDPPVEARVTFVKLTG